MLIGFLLLVVSALVCLAAGRFYLLSLSGGPAWLLSVSALVLMLVVIGWIAHRRFDGVLIDRDNRISLSRLQLILWTVVVVSGLQAAGIFNTSATFPQTIDKEVVLGPLDIKIPPEIWALLGLGSFTAVAVPSIKSRNRTRPLSDFDDASAITAKISQDRGIHTGSFMGRVYQNASPKDARWIDLVTGDYEGAQYIDVSKVQHLVLTMLLLLVYTLALYGALDKTLPLSVPIAKFPDISPGMLSLLGISHAAYLAGKVRDPS
jgi:hypothetical protein